MTVLLISIACLAESVSISASNESYGKITVSPISYQAGYEYASSMITYENDTGRTFKTIQIQCVARNAAGVAISGFKLNYSVVLGDAPLSPGTIKIKEANFENALKSDVYPVM